jgi:hypothetical protein
MGGKFLARLALAILMVLSASMTGCLTNPQRGVPINMWRPIDQPPLEAWTGPRTKLYTYVLVGEMGDGSADKSSANAKASLTALLAQLQQGIRLADDAPVARELLEAANQYCIPGTADAKDSEGRVSWSSYNRGLALQYLGVLRIAVSNSPALTQGIVGKGPFLVATRQPLASVVKMRKGRLIPGFDEPLLLMDMSGVDERVIGEHVRAYQSAIQRDVAQTSVMKPLLPAMADFLTKVDRAIPFIAEAYANSVKQWSKSGPQEIKEGKGLAS